MTKQEWESLRDKFALAKQAFSMKQKELPGYEPYAIAKYVFDGLENVAAAMAEEAEDAHVA